MNLTLARTKVNRLLGDYANATARVAEEQTALDAVVQLVADVEAAQQAVQLVAQQIQAAAHRRIASVVTRCLQAVFGEDEAYQFRIDFERKRGRTEAKLIFVRDGYELEDVMETSGGGCIDVASMAARLACLMLSQPPKRRLLLMDEPFRHLSSEFRPAARQLLLVLAKEMNFQAILVTHSAELKIGKVIELGEDE